MKLIRAAVAVAACVVVLAGTACSKPDCESDDDCPSTAYCDVELGYCFTPSDAGVDGGDPGDGGDDAGVDAGSTAEDAGTDAGLSDGGVDAGVVIGPGPRKVCGPDDWCWENPLPQGSYLTDVFIRSPSEGYAVGETGTVLVRYADGVWHGRFGEADGARFSSIAARVSTAVWVAGPNALYKVVEGPAALPLDGGQVPGANFSDVAVSSNGTLWVTDFHGPVRSFKNGTWAIEHHFDGGYPWAVAATNDSNVWVAGDLKIVQRSGTTWVDKSCDQQVCAEPCGWRDIWLDEASKPWSVGEGPGCAVRQGSSGIWEASIPPALEDSFLQVTGTSSTNVWVIGAEDVHRFDGGTWTSEISTSPARSRRLSLASPGVGAAVGANGAIGELGPTGWTERRTSAGDTDLLDVTVASDGTVLATDGDRLWRRGESGWTTESLQHPNALTTLWAASAEDVWIGGVAGSLRHWDGMAWTTVDLGLSENIVRIRGAGPDDVWLVGSSGSIRRYDGTSWTTIAPPVPMSSAVDLDVSSSGDVAFLSSGRALTWIDGSWGSVSVSGSIQRVLVHEGAAWLFGTKGIIARWTPGDAAPTYLRPSGLIGTDLADACPTSAGEILFVGGPRFVNWNGTSFDELPSPTSIAAVACGLGTAFAVGQAGLVLGQIR